MHVDLQKDGCTKEETVTRSVQCHGACEFFKWVICLYNERAVLEHSLSLLLSAEVMKPFVVVRKGFHF